jgi:hypothetical protein
MLYTLPTTLSIAIVERVIMGRLIKKRSKEMVTKMEQKM